MTMSPLHITNKIQQIHSEKGQQELEFFLDYLLTRQSSEATPKKIPKFGCAKGTFKMADDFDAPLDDFRDYML